MKKIGLYFICLFFGGVCVAQVQDSSYLKDKYLMVLDMQEHFTNDVLNPDTATLLLDNINRIVKAADPDKVIYIKSVLSVLNLSLKGFQVNTLDGLDLDERLLVVSPHIFEKNKANALLQEDIINFLNKRKAAEVIIVGLMAEHCIVKTAMGAKREGFQVIVLPHCIAGKTLEGKARVLVKLERKGITLGTHLPQ
jgi:nicotinamidase-related amidase